MSAHPYTPVREPAHPHAVTAVGGLAGAVAVGVPWGFLPGLTGWHPADVLSMLVGGAGACAGMWRASAWLERRTDLRCRVCSQADPA